MVVMLLQTLVESCIS